MLSLDDCIAMSGLSRAEVEAIAAHEHCQMIIAAEIGWNLLNSAQGRDAIKGIMESRSRVSPPRTQPAIGNMSRSTSIAIGTRTWP